MGNNLLIKNRSLLIFFLLFLLPFEQGCTPAIDSYDFKKITLSRGRCFGACPIYEVVIEDDGRVTYLGEKFVKIKGKKESKIDKKKLEEIKIAFKEADYFNLKDSYEKTEATDMPTIVTSIEVKNKRKRIVHYLGDFSAPEKLTRLEDKIDEIVDTNKWIGR